MFTGIVEEIGKVKAITIKETGAVISVQCSKILEDIKVGDSIAINGACQTAVKIGADFFEAEAAIETLKLTNLGALKAGNKVNLERAMSATSRFGGHMVTGHIEGTGKFVKKEKQGIAEIFFFEVPDSIEKYLVYKGSVCINGISLTIALLEKNTISISVIPHTVKETNLLDLKIGDYVNLETDIIAKYVEKFMSKSDNTGRDISIDFLRENGFY